jgi:aquaporin Z
MTGIDNTGKETGKSIGKPVAGEFIGTFLIMFATIFTASIVPALSGGFAVLYTTLATTLSYFVATFLFSHVSGGYFNPVLAIYDAFRRRVSAKVAFLFVLAEFIGGILGALLVRFVLPGSSSYPVERFLNQAVVGYSSSSPTAKILGEVGLQIDILPALILEIIFTFIIILVFAKLTKASSTDSKITRATILAITYGLGALALGIVDGASLNPVHAVAAALAAFSTSALQQLWVFILAPAAALLIAVIVKVFVDPKATNSGHHEIAPTRHPEIDVVDAQDLAATIEQAPTRHPDTGAAWGQDLSTTIEQAQQSDPEHGLWPSQDDGPAQGSPMLDGGAQSEPAPEPMRAPTIAPPSFNTFSSTDADTLYRHPEIDAVDAQDLSTTPTRHPDTGAAWGQDLNGTAQDDATQQSDPEHGLWPSQDDGGAQGSPTPDGPALTGAPHDDGPAQADGGAVNDETTSMTDFMSNIDTYLEELRNSSASRGRP